MDFDRHHRQDRAHVRVVAVLVGKDHGGHRVLDAGAGEIVRVARVAADEVQPGTGRVALRRVDEHDLRLVVVALELLDQLARDRLRDDRTLLGVLEVSARDDGRSERLMRNPGDRVAAQAVGFGVGRGYGRPRDPRSGCFGELSPDPPNLRLLGSIDGRNGRSAA